MQVKEEGVNCEDDVSGFGPACLGPVDTRSEPRGNNTLPNTPSVPSSFPASASIAVQTVYALEKYGDAGSNVAVGVLQQQG